MMFHAGARQLFAATFVVCLAGISSCVDATAAPEQCETVRDAYCEISGEECASLDVAQCLAFFDDAIVCADAVGVDPDYETCLDEIDELTECPSSLPTACQGVIYFEPEPE